eukprot:364949-Chlamydomonas_euryale.AAC.1
MEEKRIAGLGLIRHVSLCACGEAALRARMHACGGGAARWGQAPGLVRHVSLGACGEAVARMPGSQTRASLHLLQQPLPFMLKEAAAESPPPPPRHTRRQTHACIQVHAPPAMVHPSRGAATCASAGTPSPRPHPALCSGGSRACA